MPKDDFTDVLGYWLCLEYLNPQRLEDSDPENHAWHCRKDAELPWVDPAKAALHPPTKNRVWCHTVSFGVLSMRELMPELKRVLGVEAEPDQIDMDVSGEAATLALTVDAGGCLVGEVAFSSLPWAMGRLAESTGTRRVNFEGFSGRDAFEAQLKVRLLDRLKEMTMLLPSEDGGERRRPVTIGDLQQLQGLLFEECGWAPERSLLAKVATRGFTIRREADPKVDAGLLNSFLSPDILKVLEAYRSGKVPTALRAYMNGLPPGSRVDVRESGGKAFVADATMPGRLPIGRWPSRYPLALAQQFAVNMAIAELGPAKGVFSVNGPPGSGKSTLLRDLIAQVVVDRATALAGLPRAAGAFSQQEKLRFNEDMATWKVPDAISGFGVVVASTNNGAVENISRELPARKSVDAPGVELDYFAAVADGLITKKNEKGAAERRCEPGKAWGIIAAVLGNRSNCQAFANRFWGWEGASKLGYTSFPDALAAVGALPWDEAKARFNDALRRSSKAIADRQEMAVTIRELMTLRARLSAAASEEDRIEEELAGDAAAADAAALRECEAAGELTAAEEDHRVLLELENAAALAGSLPAPAAGVARKDLVRAALQAGEIHAAAADGARHAADTLSNLRLTRPNFLVRFLSMPTHREWSARFNSVIDEQQVFVAASRDSQVRIRAAEESLAVYDAWDDAAREEELLRSAARIRFGERVPTLAMLELRTAALLRELEATRAARQATDRRQAETRGSLATTRTGLGKLEGDRRRVAARLGDHGVQQREVDTIEAAEGDEGTHQAMAPWHDANLWSLRHEVFVAALDLHKSFLKENREAVLDNIRVLVNVITGGVSRRAVTKDRLQGAWETLFLAVPTISTTFASVGRLFDNVGPNGIGWLVVDEAGQAAPQAALGAIWRSSRVVVVGDPLQIEPVVPLPEAAIEMSRLRFGVGDEWHPIRNSVQVLADRANTWGTQLGEKWLGAPLRVHRRCLDPMFSVSNEIAYDGMMVYGTAPSAKADIWLGRSAWIHVASAPSEGHWIPEEGQVAIRIVREIASIHGLRDKEDKANVYVISPFKNAAEGMAKLLAAPVERSLLKDAGSISGTVHTFQGKEAQVVVLVLGGDPSRPGAITGYAARLPNLLNVAATRAQSRLYVVGDHARWSSAKYFSILAARLVEGSGRPYLSPDEFFMRAMLESIPPLSVEPDPVTPPAGQLPRLNGVPLLQGQASPPVVPESQASEVLGVSDGLLKTKR